MGETYPDQVRREERAEARKRRRGRSAGRNLLAIRINELARYLTHRYGETFPNDDAARDDALVMACHLARTRGGEHEIHRWLGLRTPWMTADQRDEIASTAMRLQLKWTADKLAKRIGLDFATRTALNIKTIGAIDVNADQRAERRRLAKIEYKRARRRQASHGPSI